MPIGGFALNPHFNPAVILAAGSIISEYQICAVYYLVEWNAWNVSIIYHYEYAFTFRDVTVKQILLSEIWV